MYDVFLYATTNGYFLEYDSRASDAPPLLSYLKRHVLRSKVKIQNVTEEYDIWAAWGSSEDSQWETKRQWDWARSGSIEPKWNETHVWPWGTQEGTIHDRRAVGMGSRLIVKKGTHRTQSSTIGPTHDPKQSLPIQPVPPLHTTLYLLMNIFFIEYCTEFPKEFVRYPRCKVFLWNQI